MEKDKIDFVAATKMGPKEASFNQKDLQKAEKSPYIEYGNDQKIAWRQKKDLMLIEKSLFSR